MKYLKKFETENDRTSYENGESYIEPYVSYVEGDNSVHYNKPPETRLVAKFNVSSTTNPTIIAYYSYVSGFSKVEIDGVEQPNVVSAYTFDTLGEHTVKYTLRDETSINERVFYDYCKGLTSVSIPNSVITIGREAFRDCSSLTSVTFGNNVEVIGYSAFGGCPLTSVTLPDSLTTISGGSFYGCSFSSINIPSNVTFINTDSFSSAALTSITVDSNNSVYDSRDNCNAIIETASNKLFIGCSNTIIPNTIVTIGNTAFANCNGLTSITIPDSVTTLENNAFFYCTNLASIYIGSGVTSLTVDCFTQCTALTSITIDSNNVVYDSRDNCNAIIETASNTLKKGFSTTIIPNTITTIGVSAFTYNYNITSVTIPDSVTRIGASSFRSCIGLTSVTIGSRVTNIDASAFAECYKLTTITIPDSVTSIGSSAFTSCTGLTTVTIGSGVTSIGQSTFRGCRGLQTITSLATTAPSVSNKTFQDVKTSGTLYVPQGSTGYDTWMQNANYYLGLYNWTKVEQ